MTFTSLQVNCFLLHRFKKFDTCYRLEESIFVVVGISQNCFTAKHNLTKYERKLFHAYKYVFLEPNDIHVKHISYALKTQCNYYMDNGFIYLINKWLRPIEEDFCLHSTLRSYVRKPNSEPLVTRKSRSPSNGYHHTNVQVSLNTHLDFTYTGLLGCDGQWNHGNNK